MGEKRRRRRRRNRERTNRQCSRNQFVSCRFNIISRIYKLGEKYIRMFSLFQIYQQCQLITINNYLKNLENEK